jgi:hypothetical protein
VTSLARMRLTAFVRGGRAFAPLLTAVVVISIWYGGGGAQVTEAYGSTGVVLFPVLAWQSKLLLDAEPDVQRRLARVAVGARREVGAGLAAAVAGGLGLVVVALVVPWLVRGVSLPGPGEPPLVAALGLGGWGLLLALPTAVGLGALASRAVTRRTLVGVGVLVTGSVLTIVLGLRGSVAPWLAPPVMGVARSLAADPGTFGLLLPTVHAFAWTVVALALYARLRHHRA